MKRKLPLIISCILVLTLLVTPIVYAKNGSSNKIDLDKIKKEVIEEHEKNHESATLYLSKKAENGSVTAEGVYPGGILTVSLFKYPGYSLQATGYVRFMSSVGTIWYLNLYDALTNTGTGEYVCSNITTEFNSTSIDDFLWQTVPTAATYRYYAQIYAQNYDGAVGTCAAAQSAYIY
ncbi:MAG: hypothetical protein CVU89_11395 [Firmicutes bacterium HGW-Firmicutes-14]|nr:MAG: hypothetical protein CVU89_11395 [Firmicutes bacterium HGW-Firmicutes-14]